MDDYSEGCHPNILKVLNSTNLIQQTAYGDDEYSIKARGLIREHIGHKNTPIYFVAGGTLANIMIASAALRSHEAIIAATTGHIVVRETGAIEATGHKIITVPTDDGKLKPKDIETTLANNAHYPHMAKPRLVYISNATETGTVYTKTELQELSKVCKRNDLLLLLDGARLGVALTAEVNDLSMKDITDLCDVFWIGGTKAGSLIGEAIVIPNAKIADEFDFHIKQRGGLLAKGRLLGIQFVELFSTGLFFELSQHANAMAQKLSSAISQSGYRFTATTESNQLFPVLPNALVETLEQKYRFYIWEPAPDNHSVLRMVSSWATDEQQIDALISDIQQYRD